MIIIRDTLSVTSMDHNVIPQFAMREAGINVKNTPKFQVNDSSIDNHSILLSTLMSLMLID